MKKILDPCFISLFISLTLLFVGCTENITGGGDDFPNSAIALGEVINETIEITVEEFNTVDLDSIFSETNTSVQADEYGGLSSLQKTSSSTDSLRFDFSDSIQGLVHRYYYYHSDYISIADTTTFRMEDTLVTLKKGRTEYPKLSTVYGYLIEDFDGDGVLEDPGSDVNRVLSHNRWFYQSGRSTYTKIGIDAGMDGSLQGDDNGILFMTHLYSEGADTIYYLDLRGAEGYDYIVPVTELDSVTVEVHRIWFSPSSRPHVSKSEASYRLIHFPQKTKPDYLNSYTAFESLFDNRELAIEFKNSTGESFFKAGDTIDIYHTTTADESDMLVYDSTVYRLQLGSQYPDFDDIKLLEKSLTRKNRRGTNLEYELQFAPDTPSPIVEKRPDGAFEFVCLQHNSREITIRGIITAEETIGQYDDSHGNTHAVRWDRYGNYLPD